MPQTSAQKRSVGARLTAKAGPLPVWLWAAVILGGYLLYTRFSSSSSTTPATSSTTDQTPVTADTGSPPASGQGGAADNLNGDLLSQLSGFQASVDALTAAVQSTPAFQGGSDSGSGALVPNGVPTPTPAAAAQPTAPAGTTPAAKPKPPTPTRRAVRAAPKPKPKPRPAPVISGYSQRSRAHLH